MNGSLENNTILVVDDDVDTCELLRAVFENAGAIVLTVHSLDAALAAFRQCPPHAVVADIRLADSDGYALMKAIRSINVEYKGFTPVVAITGYASPEDQNRAKSAGFSAYFTKPFDPADILDAIRSVLRPTDLAA
jgi:CheY-like chemotaxis protein